MPSQDLQRFFLPLLREHVSLRPDSRVLDLGYYDPAAALVAAGAAGHVLALRPTVDLATELERMARDQRVSSLEVRLGDGITPDERGSFHVAQVLAPFFLGNGPVRKAIQTAAAALRPDGALYFQVHRKAGGATFVRFAEETFGDVELLGMGGGQRRLYVAREPRAAADDAAAGGAETAAQHAELTARGVTVRLKLAAGVFSARGVDAGSKLLVQTLEVPSGAQVLDLGCGAGTIGLTLALADRRAHVTLVDNAKAAVDLAKENAALNGVQNAEVLLGDGYGPVEGRKFDVIVSNLPAHRGHQVDTSAAERFIAQAPAHIRDQGEVWVVANKALPYELPASRSFREVRQAATNGRFKVLVCRGPKR
jgi:16S rRNA (guanine1207-N2)-methyltransferase